VESQAGAAVDLPHGGAPVLHPLERKPRGDREIRIDPDERVVEVVLARRVDERRATTGVERLALAGAGVAYPKSPSAPDRRGVWRGGCALGAVGADEPAGAPRQARACCARHALLA